MAQPGLITEFLKTKDSYNLNAVTQAVGLAALNDYESMKRNAARVAAPPGNAPRRPWKRSGSW